MFRPALTTRILSLIAAAIAATGCSTIVKLNPQPNERRGLFEVLSELEETGGRLYIDPGGGVNYRVARRLARGWMWPLESVTITSPFGGRSRGNHEGIDLRARVGTPVLAAAPGRVIYSGSRISGYGNMVILKHRSGLVTVYAHHKKNLVSKGESVDQGQKIALSGNTGRSTGPHLHFEIRKGDHPLDPQAVMPSRRTLASRGANRI